MIEKQIMIPKTVYESIDGTQFDNKYDAEKWDCQVYLNNNMKDRYCGIIETGYCLLNSKEEANILEILSRNDRIQKGFYAHYLNDKVEFPIMVKFKEEKYGKPTTVVTTNDYNRFKGMAEKFKKLCSMYESVSEQNKQIPK